MIIVGGHFIILAIRSSQGSVGLARPLGRPRSAAAAAAATAVAEWPEMRK